MGYDVSSGIQDLKIYSHTGSPSPPSQRLVGRRKECGAGLYKSIDVPKSDLRGKLTQLAKNGAFFEAPVGIIVTVDRMFDRCGWGNVGMFLATFALLCEEAGLSTCFQGYFGINHQVCRNVITEISDDHVVWC